MPKEEKNNTTTKKEKESSQSLLNRMGKAISDAVDYAVTGHEDSKK